MTFPIYPRQAPRTELFTQRPSFYSTHLDAEGYRPDDGLVAAVNVALTLGQPLLLTGEPGTGKTALAHHLSENLGLGKPLEFEAKSNSTARDLFYTVDAVGRFQAPPGTDPRRFITFQALGLAVLRANPRGRVEHLLPPEHDHQEPRVSVVLIDEIDKAPRDFPNDVLTEIERKQFRVPELDSEPVRAPDKFRPILVITSNSEKNLPDAFLRRCAYYDIPFPLRSELEEIVLRRVKWLTGEDRPDLAKCLDFFFKLRERSTGLQKRPATAELLGWIEYLGARSPDRAVSFDTSKERLSESLPCLVKTSEDQARAQDLLEAWQRR